MPRSHGQEVPDQRHPKRNPRFSENLFSLVLRCGSAISADVQNVFACASPFRPSLDHRWRAGCWPGDDITAHQVQIGVEVGLAQRAQAGGGGLVTWASCFTSLSLSLLICQMGTVLLPMQGCGEGLAWDGCSANRHHRTILAPGHHFQCPPHFRAISFEEAI